MSARVVVIAGLGYGDEGKGSTVDWLARQRETTLVVRYNGGAQAAHNVVDGDRHHTFAQFGSGTFAGAPTLLSRHTLVNPLALLAEARHLESLGVDAPLARVCVEGEALVTTPYHVAMNRLREMARTGRHGSCGMGIGETMQDALADPAAALRVADLSDVATLRRKLAAVRERKLAEARALALPLAESVARELSVLEDARATARTLDGYAAFAARVAIVDRTLLARTLEAPGQVIFEGAQGVLLDQDFGFQPHTTWTDITFANARELLAGFGGDVTRLGILRAYATRHGAGPFVTEDRAFDALSAHDHNSAGEWQGTFRSGAADLVATRYALDVLGGAGALDGLVVTNLDRLVEARSSRVPIAVAYEGATDPRYFEGRARRIERIALRRPFDLAHQEALTRALLDVRPLYEHVETSEPRGLVAYAETLADRLAVPLAAISFGATAADKLALGATNPHTSGRGWGSLSRGM